mgnify:FL=1
MDGFLPIGSVVLLKGAQKKLMIIGRFQVSVKTEKIYDYSGCLYPEGFMNPQDLFLFQNDDIEKVYFVGMQDEEEFAYRDFLVKEIHKQAENQRKEEKKNNVQN